MTRADVVECLAAASATVRETAGDFGNNITLVLPLTQVFLQILEAERAGGPQIVAPTAQQAANVVGFPAGAGS